MATTVYAYSNNESLLEIAKLYNTDVKTLVQLNSWLKDPIDGHTNCVPSNTKISMTVDAGLNAGSIELYVPIIPGTCEIVVEYKNGFIETYRDSVYGKLYAESSCSLSRIKFKTIDYNNYYIEYINGLEVKQMNITYIPVTKQDYLVVPLIGNGNSSIEDYWDRINSTLGIHTNILIDNLISAKNSGSINNINNKNGYISSLSAPNLDKFTMDYVDYNLNDINSELDSTTVDFLYAEVGQITQNIINSSALNIATYTNSNKSINALDITGSKLGIGRLNSTKENTIGSKFYTNNRYSFIGNASYGKCKVVVGTTTLWMPCWPEGVQDSIDANYEEGTVVGRSEPYIVYSGTGPRTIEFTFDMHREMTGNEDEIETIVKYLESAVYPNYNSSVAATRVRVEIGSQICISGVMRKCNTNWHGPIDENGKYKLVTVSFSVTESTGSPKSSADIRSIGGFRD